MGTSLLHLGEAYFGINFQINIKLQKLTMIQNENQKLEGI